MGSFSDYLELELLDHVFGNAAYSAPATLYVALFTATPNDAGGGTECVGTDYARVAVTNNATNWPAAAAGAKSNGTVIEFAAAGADDWGTLTSFGIFDADAAGNLLGWGALTQSKTPTTGDVCRFAVGELQITLD